MMRNGGFHTGQGLRDLKLPGAKVSYNPAFLSSERADDYFRRLLDETPWRQDDIKVFGKVYPQPRLTALYGESGKPYTYSGITMHPKPFTPLLLELRDRVEKISGCRFTTVLLNLYRDGADSNGWHADDEKELGSNPVIASISLGQVRRFKFRHKKDKNLKADIDLDHGSLLLMAGATQHNWKHQLPKTARKVGPRINLTFRFIETT